MSLHASSGSWKQWNEECKCTFELRMFFTHFFVAGLSRLVLTSAFFLYPPHPSPPAIADPGSLKDFLCKKAAGFAGRAELSTVCRAQMCLDIADGMTFISEQGGKEGGGGGLR